MRWIMAAVVGIVLAALTPTAAFAAPDPLHPDANFAITADLSCDNPMTLTNTVHWTFRNNNDFSVQISEPYGDDPVKAIGTHVLAPGDSVEATVFDVGPESDLKVYTYVAFWVKAVDSNLPAVMAGKEFPLLTCTDPKPTITFPQACNIVNVTLSLPPSSQ